MTLRLAIAKRVCRIHTQSKRARRAGNLKKSRRLALVLRTFVPGRLAILVKNIYLGFLK
jgi:hypothetical protein